MGGRDPGAEREPGHTQLVRDPGACDEHQRDELERAEEVLEAEARAEEARV